MKPIKLKGLLKEEKQSINEAELTSKKLIGNIVNRLYKNADKIAKELLPNNATYTIGKEIDGFNINIDIGPGSDPIFKKKPDLTRILTIKIKSDYRLSFKNNKKI